MKSQTQTSVGPFVVRLSALSDVAIRRQSTQSGLVPMSLLLDLCDEQEKQEQRVELLRNVSTGLIVGAYLSFVHVLAFLYLLSL